MTNTNTFQERLAAYEIARDTTLNPDAAGKFRANQPSLTPAQSRVVEELNRDGIATVGFQELFGSAVDWTAVDAAMRSFTESDEAQAKAKAYRENFGSTASKEYIIRSYEKGASFGEDNLWLRLGLSEPMLNIVNTSLGLWSKLTYMDLWFTPPVADPRDAVASQQWHRDPEDEKLVKVFLYCVDVDETTGPFEYLKGSFIGGRYGQVWPLPKQALLNIKGSPEVAANHAERKSPPGLDSIPKEEHKICTAPAGTLVFCNTSGIHRGGFAVNHPRILAHWTFTTPASVWPRRFTANVGGDFGDAARFAIAD